MALRRVHLTDETGTVDQAELEAVAEALQIQVTRDLGPEWGVKAKVTVGKPTKTAWMLRIVDPSQLPEGAGGVHLDHHGLPYAIVEPGKDWTIAASHELVEMMVDPFGRKMVTAPSIDPKAGGRPVHYLVEVGDPVEVYGYKINGVTVSDFVLQDYYHPAMGEQLDHLSRLTKPFQVPKGCYISWYDPADSRWHQKRPDGSIVTAMHTSKLGEHPRRERDLAFRGEGEEDQHALRRVLGQYEPELASLAD